MGKLFDIVKNEVRLNPDIIAVPAFNVLWERDTSRNKTTAKKELSYIVFLSDFKSPYRDLPPKEKVSIIRADIFGKRSDWKPDELVQEAIDKYRQLQKTPTMYLLESAEEAVDKLANYFRTVDFEGADDIGKAAKDLASSVVTVGNIRKSLSSLKQQVETEISDTNARGNTEIYYYENPESVQKLKGK
jgi:hypothetical protein